jgi:predicted nucleic acid-binding protein
VLLRLADDQSSEHPVAESALEQLLARGVPVFITAQVLVEFWSVATRPVPVNGLGWSVAASAEAVRALRDQFPLLQETPEVLDRWLDVVDRCQVAGKRAHDARLAAILLVHGVRSLLTFNTSDFSSAWGVEAVHPEQLLAKLH